MLSSYLNQSAQYEAQTGTDDRGQAIFAAPVAIPCRKEVRTAKVFSATSATVKPQTVYYTTHEVREGGKLDGKVTQSAEEWVGLGGRTEGFKAVI